MHLNAIIVDVQACVLSYTVFCDCAVCVCVCALVCARACAQIVSIELLVKCEHLY